MSKKYKPDPAAWARMKGGKIISVFHDKGVAEFLSGFAASELVPLHMHAQPAPDVTLLLELLSHARCNTCDGSGGFYDNHGNPHQCQWRHDRSAALATHRKGGDK